MLICRCPQLRNADLRNLDIVYINWFLGDFSGANFSDGHIGESSFYDTNLQGTDFTGAMLEDVDSAIQILGQI